MNHSKQSIEAQQNTLSSTLFQAEAWRNACIKLLPQHMIKNPVMAIVWLGTIITLASTLLGKANLVFGLSVTFILFITVLFANYAEAVAEAKGRGQALSLRQARQNLTARRIQYKDDVNGVQISATELKMSDLIEVRAGELIPADGEIVYGFATINEAAVTGESAPVLREAGTDKSGVIVAVPKFSRTVLWYKSLPKQAIVSLTA